MSLITVKLIGAAQHGRDVRAAGRKRPRHQKLDLKESVMNVTSVKLIGLLTTIAVFVLPATDAFGRNWG
jgi:hypothetical protein